MKGSGGMLLSLAPPHRAALSSLLPTRLNHRLRPLQLTESKIDNKVSGMKNWWPVVGCSAPGWRRKVARRLAGAGDLHVSGAQWRAREEHRQPRVTHGGRVKSERSNFLEHSIPFQRKMDLFVHF